MPPTRILRKNCNALVAQNNMRMKYRGSAVSWLSSGLQESSTDSLQLDMGKTGSLRLNMGSSDGLNLGMGIASGLQMGLVTHN